MSSASEAGQRRKLVIWTCVWLPIIAFWLLATIVAGAAVFAVLVLAPVLLALLSLWRGTESLPAPVVYVLGAAPAVAFPVIAWKWPIGLLLIVMIFAYEQVLETILHLRVARGTSTDPGLALTRVRRISLIMISVDAQAAGVDPLWLVLAIVAIVRLDRLTVTLAFAGLVVSVIAFVTTGAPNQFTGIELGIGVDPLDVDTLFAIETFFLGALPLWARTVRDLWR